jgi:acetyl-CoA carboxylase carboxyltransferase component
MSKKKKPPEAAEGWQPEIEELHWRREQARQMGGAEALEKFRQRGLLNARQRIDAMLDDGTFHEYGILAGAAQYDEAGRPVKVTPANHVMGTGEIDGRRVMCVADDFTLRGGSSESAVSDKWVYSERMAYEFRMPLVRLVDSAGGSVKLVEQMGRTKVPGYFLWPCVQLLGIVPVVSIALGACAGLGAVRAALSHFSIMVEGKAQIFAGGPPIVKQGIGRDIHKEELGGWKVHKHSGVVHNGVKTEEEGFGMVRRFLSYLPRHVWDVPERTAPRPPLGDAEELNKIVPRDRRRVFKSRKVIELIFDEGSIFEIQPTFGASKITCLARLDGYTVGVMADNSYVQGGSLTRDGAQKLEHFIDLCDTFHIPIINLPDQPGTMIGVEAESIGTVLFAARATCAIEQATTPWVTVVLRRNFGLGGTMHGPWHGPTGTSMNHRFSWPSARWGSIPAEGGVAAAYRREIEASDDPEALRLELEEKYHQLASPFRTAEKFGVVDVMEPAETRKFLCDWIKDAYELSKTQTGPLPRTMRV